MRTKNNSQKIVSAKILAKLLELATKCVIPCITTSTPGKYTAKELWQGKDSFGNNVWWNIDDEHNGDELSVTITAEDFTAEEMAILGYEPKLRLQIKLEKIFYAISKYEQLASVRGNVAKFVVGEPETLYETERAKVVLFDYAKQKIVTKTKTITIISDSLALYPTRKKDYCAFCLKINGKWINVLNSVRYFDIAETIERAKKIITYESTKSGAQKYIDNNSDAYADFAKLILSELEAMRQSDAETAPAVQAANNGSADSESNANVATESKANAETSKSTGNDTANEPKEKQQHTEADAPQSNESAPPEQSKREKTRGRKIAYFSEFCGCGDKECHPSGENRNMGIYCGKNADSRANARGSPAKNICYLTRV